MRVSVERIGIIAGLRRRENASLSQCKLGGSNKDFPKRFIENHDQAMPVVRYVDNDDNASEKAHMTELAPFERAKLRQFLSDRFSQGELKALAFDLGADYEVMKHSDKEELSVELVSYLQRRDQLRCLVEEALKRRPGVDIDMTDLLAKLPPCLPSRKVQIILADDMPIEITTLKEELSILFGVNREQVAFIGIARESTRLLISLPGRAGDARDSGEARGIGEGKYRIVSTDPFESLPLVSQEAWRMIIWKRPPTCQDGVFKSDASWEQALMAAKKGPEISPSMATISGVTEPKSYATIANGSRVHIVEEGQPGRQIALLIHDWSNSWYGMSPLLGLLAQRFRAIALDLPGYGESPAFSERTTLSAYVDLLADLIVDLTGEPVVLVGHSMGGMISLALALRYPALVERMVLISPTISGRLSPYVNLVVSPITLLERFRLGRWIVAAVERTVMGLTDRIVRPASYAQRTDITFEQHERLQADFRRRGQGRVRAECFYAMRENDLSGRLHEVQVPALVLWGAEDNMVPLRDAGIVANEWPDADLRILPNAGHWPHFENADTTRRQVAAYLGLPRFSDELHSSVEDSEWVRIREAARFLAHSDLGNELNLAQRMRLAAQCQQRIYRPRDVIVRTNEPGDELFIIQSGAIEVWSSLDPRHRIAKHAQLLAVFESGKMVGESAVLSHRRRNADLIAGPNGAVVLGLTRNRLLALCEDDAVLGSQLLWNLARAVEKRAGLINEQRAQILARREQTTHATRPLPPSDTGLTDQRDESAVPSM